MRDPILIDLPDELRGERVLVRPYRPGDGAALQAAVASSRDFLRPWMVFADEHQTVEESEKLVRMFAGKYLLREELTLSMWDIASGTFVGGTGIHPRGWELRKFEIGYWIREDFAGRGLVTEAVRLLLPVAFGPLEAKRVIIRCSTQNEKSKAIPERIGFRLEGIARNDIKVHGEYHDSYVYSLTPEDYEVLRGAGA